MVFTHIYVHLYLIFSTYILCPCTRFPLNENIESAKCVEKILHTFHRFHVQISSQVEIIVTMRVKLKEMEQNEYEKHIPLYHASYEFTKDLLIFKAFGATVER